MFNYTLKILYKDEQKEESLEKLPQNPLDESLLKSPTIQNKKIRALVIDVVRDIEKREKTKFPLSATLPMHRKLSDLEQTRKQSNHEMPTLTPTKKSSDMSQACLICYDHPPNAVFMDCGHGGKITMILHI